MINVRPSRTRLRTREKLTPDVAPDRPVMYVRKSSEGDDEQAASHERQKRDLNEVIIRDGWDVDTMAHYEESRSAKLPGRPDFNEMMDRIEAGELNIIYTHEISRLCRNMLDGGRLIHFLQRGLIRRIVTPYRIYNPEDNTLLIAIEASISTEEIRTLTRRVASSITNKHAKGQYPGKAPIGYMNDRFGIKGDRTILTDPERFELVQGIWQKMLTGAYTAKQLSREVRAMGLTTIRYGKNGGGILGYSALHAMFCNPFYCGLYQWGGVIYQGSHTPMITVAEFERVQYLLTRPSLPRSQSHRRAAEVVPYMGGLFMCGSCGKAITAETHIKTNKAGKVHHYVYLRCTKKGNNVVCPEKYLSIDEFERQVSVFLENLTLPASIAEWTLRHLREENASEQMAQQQVLSQIQQALDQNQTARKILTDLLLAGRIEEEEFEQRRSELVQRGRFFTENLARHTSRSNHWLEEIEGALSFCRSLKQRFDQGSPEHKRQILELVGSNRYIRGKKIVIQPDEFFTMVRSGNETGDWCPLLDHVRKIVRGEMSSLGEGIVALGRFKPTVRRT